jgi:glycosyltransferase involved in cell wall biosynthesis
VLTIHGNMAPLARQFRAFPGSYLWFAGHLENFTLPRTEGVLCNSVYTEAFARPRSQRTWLIPNSLRPAFFAPSSQHPSGPRPRLINVGVISPLKRQLELLALFKRLHDQGHACQIEFVGKVDADEPYGRKFLRAIDQAGAQGYAFYSGTMKEEALIEAFDHADGSVHFSTAESFGLVVAEALSRNLKFFGTRVGGIIDITASVEGAELFDMDDWTGLEQALVRWMREGCPRPRNAAQIMAGRYHPRVIAGRHVEIYREVLSSRQS